MPVDPGSVCPLCVRGPDECVPSEFAEEAPPRSPASYAALVPSMVEQPEGPPAEAMAARPLEGPALSGSAPPWSSAGSAASDSSSSSEFPIPGLSEAREGLGTRAQDQPWSKRSVEGLGR